MDVDNSNNLLSNNSKSSATKNKIGSNETTATITKQSKDNILKLLHGTPTRRRKLSSNNATNSISKRNDDDDLICPIEARVTILLEATR